MAQKNDYLISTLSKAALEWGTHRYTNSRGYVYGEGYLPIHAEDARRLELYNNNGTDYENVYGENLFHCSSVDGLFEGVLRSQGNRAKGDIYAKQFAGDKNLKALGHWFREVNAQEGDQVKVTWISPTEICIELLSE